MKKSRALFAALFPLVFLPAACRAEKASGVIAPADRGMVFLAAGGLLLVALLLLAATLWSVSRKLKEARNALEGLEALRKTFWDASDCLLSLKDEAFKYVFVNRAMAAFFGRPAEQIAGRTDPDLVGEDEARRRRESDAKALSSPEGITQESEWNGRILQAHKFPVTLPNGKTGVGAVVRDITGERNDEKKRALALRCNDALADILSRGFASGQEQLDYMLDQALQITESAYGYIFACDEDKRQLTLRSRGKDGLEDCGDSGRAYELDHAGVWGEVIRQRRHVVVNNPAGPDPLKGGDPIERFLSVPVMLDGRIMAVLGVANKKSDYGDDDVYHTLLLMSSAWNAVIRREAREKLSLERNKYQQTLLSIGDGVMVVDGLGRIEMLNAAAQEMTGWSQEEALGRDYREVFVLSHEQEGTPVQDPIQRALQLQRIVEMDSHAVLTSRNGKRYFLEDSAAPIKDEEGAVLGAVLVFRNMTEKREQQREIEFLSYHDALTGLYNRRFFEEELRRLDTKRNLPISLIIGDVNNLKLTNDVFGHAYGDMLLKSLAAVLKKICRADDIIARWGGDEFSLLLPKTGLAEARLIILRIREEFGKVQVKAVKGSVSMGAAVKLTGGERILDAVDKAEEEMYSAKALERGELMKGTLDTIVGMLHASSPREKEHAVFVSRLCQAMGRRMGLAEDEVKKLSDAGYLHDIGKIVLEGKLLSGDHSPTPQEWSEIKRHPVTGYRILNAFDSMPDLARIVLTHQERWDGSGYPKGLTGEQIPREARIIALSESYERKLRGACSNPPMGREEALEAIESGKGKHFDPALTDVFTAMLREEGDEGVIA